MVNKEIITHLKSCIIGLGLTHKGKSKAICINGTGFFIDEDGYFVTADHVVDDMQKIRDEYHEKGIELDFRGFWYENVDEEHGQLLAIKIEHGRSVHINIPEIPESIPEIQDLMIGRVSGTDKFPFLNFLRSSVQIPLANPPCPEIGGLKWQKFLIVPEGRGGTVEPFYFILPFGDVIVPHRGNCALFCLIIEIEIDLLILGEPLCYPWALTMELVHETAESNKIGICI